MIKEIYLENFLFIKEARLSFQKGLNVITGETGAGKSVLLEAVKLLLGKKARSGLVMSGCKTARVQAEFDIAQLPDLIDFLDESGFVNEDEPDNLVISRSFKEAGSGKVIVNSILATSTFLKKLGKNLMEIHGQNEHQTLLNSDVQRQLVDRAGDQNHHSKLIKLFDAYTLKKQLEKKYNELEQKFKTSSETIAQLQQTLKELSSLNLQNQSEEDELKNELKKLSHSEQIINGLENARTVLEGTEEVRGAVSLLKKASDFLGQTGEYEDAAKPMIDRAKDLFYEAQALESDVAQLAETIDLDPERLYEVQARLAEISRACRKHDCTFEGLFELKESVNKQLSELFEPDNTLKNAQIKLEQACEYYQQVASEVSEKRKVISQKLSDKVSESMQELGFNKASFEPVLINAEPGPEGKEKIEFFVSLNPGAPGGPLKKIASGGELSRVALAIKKELAKSDRLPTLLFDEIDAGIGGQTAQAVAESLAKLAEQKQILLVTHLHQIAKEADTHFVVNKNVKNDNTQINIGIVEKEERVKEIARMLGKKDSQGMSFARNLLKS